jgi:hypothetical protein
MILENTRTAIARRASCTYLAAASTAKNSRIDWMREQTAFRLLSITLNRVFGKLLGDVKQRAMERSVSVVPKKKASKLA